MNFRSTILVFTYCLLPGFNILCAQLTADTSTTKVVSTYMNAIGQNALLYNGSEYYYDDRSLNGHPFLSTTDFRPGTVNYFQNHYSSVLLSYDILRDELIAFLPSDVGDVKLKLVKEKVKQFSIGDRQFVQLQKDSTALPLTGFYELLFDGKYQLLVRRSKKIKENVSAAGVDKQVVEENNFYIRRGNLFYAVNSKSSLLNVAKNHKQELSKFIRQSDIKFNKDVEYNLLRAIRKLDQITTD